MWTKLLASFNNVRVYWYLRSRVVELKDGDKNTQYFHHKASQRKKRDYVKGLFDAGGAWCEEEEDTENILTNYFFSNIFTSAKTHLI